MVRQLGTPGLCEEVVGVRNDCEIGNVIDTVVRNRLPPEQAQE
jgi:hypothetical protein